MSEQAAAGQPRIESHPNYVPRNIDDVVVPVAVRRKSGEIQGGWLPEGTVVHDGVEYTHVTSRQPDGRIAEKVVPTAELEALQREQQASTPRPTERERVLGTGALTLDYSDDVREPFIEPETERTGPRPTGEVVTVPRTVQELEAALDVLEEGLSESDKIALWRLATATSELETGNATSQMSPGLRANNTLKAQYRKLYDALRTAKNQER